MTDAFQVAIGNNNTGGLVTLDPQPDSDGAQYPRVIDTPSTGYFDGKLFTLLRFPDIVTPDAWVTTLARFGLSDPSVREALVTVRLPNENKSSYSNFNGRAVRSQHTPHEYCYYKTPEILVRRLVAL